jgi:glyoxylase-like metal-dependent hydrolase (beta-lactamase superfamily II)
MDGGYRLFRTPVTFLRRRSNSHWTAINTTVPPFNDSVLPIVEAKRADMVSGDHHVDDLVRLLPTAGHAPGHTAVYFGRDGADGVISGDLMHSPLQARYPELSIVFDVDPAQAAINATQFPGVLLRYAYPVLPGALPVPIMAPYQALG